MWRTFSLLLVLVLGFDFESATAVCRVRFFVYVLLIVSTCSRGLSLFRASFGYNASNKWILEIFDIQLAIL